MREQHETLQQLWLRYAQGIGIASQTMPLLTQLTLAWSESHRHYHSLRHLQECLQRLEHWGLHSPVHHEVGVALWFHDAIYDTARHDNEERSARWAGRALKALGVDADVVRRIGRLVRATRHDARAYTGEGSDLMLDIDLSILGVDRARFEEYERQVRLEYGHVPDEAFARGRAAFVDSMLKRARIYRTEAGHRELEERARANLLRSLQRWTAKISPTATLPTPP